MKLFGIGIALGALFVVGLLLWVVVVAPTRSPAPTATPIPRPVPALFIRVPIKATSRRFD